MSQSESSMLFVVKAEEGALEVNWMWLPTWIGLNTKILKRLEDALGPLFLNRELGSSVLQEAHEAVIEHLCRWYPEIHGLRDYLRNVTHVRLPETRSVEPAA